MGNEKYFEMRVTNGFERKCEENGVEYLVKYSSDSGSLGYVHNSRRGIVTILNKSHFSVFVKFKLYRISNQDCVLTQFSVLETYQAKFEVNLGRHNYGTSPMICSVQVSKYEKCKNIIDSARKLNAMKIVTSSKNPITESRLDDLSSDMKRLLEQGELSDVILSDGSNEIRAHKLILSARSKVFSKMFQHSMKENRENSVTITDVPFEILKEMLTFIYTGVITIKDMEMARDLYMAADKYDVKELKAACSKNLKEVDLDSVLDTLALADLYGDSSLKQSVLDFISANYSQVKTKEKWGTLMKENKVLALEVLSFVLDKRS